MNIYPIYGNNLISLKIRRYLKISKNPSKSPDGKMTDFYKNKYKGKHKIVQIISQIFYKMIEILINSSAFWYIELFAKDNFNEEFLLENPVFKGFLRFWPYNHIRRFNYGLFHTWLLMRLSMRLNFRHFPSC